MTVVDASVATAWFVSIGTSDRAAAIRLEPEISAPAFLKVELTSSLLKYLRAGVLPKQSIRQAVDEIGFLIQNWLPDDELLQAATEIAISQNHKIYDCLYLALARDHGESLVTADRRMAAIARQLAIEVELIEPSV